MKSLTLVLSLFIYCFCSCNNKPAYNTSTEIQKNLKTTKYSETAKNITRHLQFSYGGYNFSYDFKFSKATYEYYKGLSKTQPYVNYMLESKSYPYIDKIATLLKKDADDLHFSRLQFAEMIIAFAQSMPYCEDPYNNEYDFPKHPIESIVEYKRDCEDAAICAVTFLQKFNFDVLLVQLHSHMAAAIALDGCSGEYYNYKGKIYYYIETVQPRFKIGETSSTMSLNNAILLEPFKSKTLFYENYSDEYSAVVENQPNEIFDETVIHNIVINGKTYNITGNATISINGNNIIINNKIQAEQ